MLFFLFRICSFTPRKINFSGWASGNQTATGVKPILRRSIVNRIESHPRKEPVSIFQARTVLRYDLCSVEALYTW